jgi:uncharacterized DUF497 family protein
MRIQQGKIGYDVALTHSISHLDVIKKLRYLNCVIKPDPSLEPDWDEDNVNHIANHGVRPEQVEELYYGEGPFPTLAVKTKKRRSRATEYRYRLWGTDASGVYIEAIIAPYPQYRLWRCVTAFPMSSSTQKAYLRRIKK